MQLARNFWLSRQRWRRKLEELAITLHMERKLTKQQILEYYANQVHLGRRETFSISGFGEGARAYFNKDLSDHTRPRQPFSPGLCSGPATSIPIATRTARATAATSCSA
jgi:membrane carboxypeptidase/penicillin-binding protein